jgi:ribosome-binding protein aMBF1 (putative translation factor)
MSPRFYCHVCGNPTDAAFREEWGDGDYVDVCRLCRELDTTKPTDPEDTTDE